MSLTNLQANFFVDHGYLLLDSFISQEDIAEPTELIKQALNKTGIPTSKESAIQWVKEKSTLQQNNKFLSLINKSKVKQFLEEKIFVNKIQEVKSCQIACRFPGEQCGEDGSVPNNWYETWHIDNYTEKDFERRCLPKDFSCLVGVYLSDNEEEFSGNYTLFPGSHHSVQAFSRLNGGQEYYEKNGLQKIREEVKLNNPFQIKAKRGSVIIVHRMLPHLISAPNTSKNIRTIIWYRICISTRPKNNNDPETFTNIWKEWTGLHTVLSLKSTYPEKFGKEIQEIEYKGYGHLVTYNDEYFVMRLRQNNSKPCMFASMITIKYFISKNNIEVHTNGFMNRSKHPVMAQAIKRECKTLMEMAEWISKCDYEKLIESWYPDFSEDNIKSDIKIMKFHHLHSRSKTSMMIKWAKELSLKGLIVNGEPGFLLVCGSKLDVFMNRFNCFHWKEVDEMKIQIDDSSLPNEFVNCRLDNIVNEALIKKLNY